MFAVKITRKHPQTDGIASYELVREDGAPLPTFSAGAHIDAQPRKGLLRQYSLCNAPGETSRYIIGVLHEAQSRGGSAAMHELCEGDSLLISEPRNLFPLRVEAKRSLLMAGGIGVTPILAMAEQLAADGADFAMHYCARSRSRMAFLDRLAQPHLARHVHLHSDDGAVEQRLDCERLLTRSEPGTHLYVCGPNGFMEHVLDSARRLGWPDEQLHREYFSAVPVDTSLDGSFEIQLRSGRLIRIEAHQSVTHALEANGVFVPVSCEQGVCGTCLTTVLDGVPDHRDLFLTDEEQAANDCFTPCCSRAKTPRLVLDLE